MICLSKADEHAVRHLAFNQSPPALSASHTTCQDLNGISNLREYVSSDQDEGGGGGGGGGLFGAAALDEKLRRQSQSPDPDIAAKDAGRWLPEPSSHSKAADGPDDHRRPFWAPTPRRASSFWSIVSWIASVLFTSLVLSTLNANAFWNLFRSGHQGTVKPVPGTISLDGQENLVIEPHRHRRKRESSCASGGVDKRDYNLPLHVGALFIILFVSFMGCAFPLLAAKFPGLRIPARFFFIVRHFGTGVLIATAFVHLLPTAFLSLGNPCLGSFWVTDYPAMPGAIALAAVFLVTIIEMVFHPSRHIPPAQIVSSGGGHGCMSNMTYVADENQKGCTTGNGTQHPVRDMGPLNGRQSSVAQGLSQLDRSTSARIESGRQKNEGSAAAQDKAVSTDSAEEESLDMPALSTEQKARKDRLQCILLEMGILFHSVFIGMALSVSIGNEFIILLIAIIFHQTFEGLALGSRIAAVRWEKKTVQPWLMVLAYGCTTPLGQAIGLATHTLYSPDSEVGLILVGVMNAISAGLLTFASLVELLSEDFLSDASWRYLRGRQRVYACLLVFFGAFGMSLVGAWA